VGTNRFVKWCSSLSCTERIAVVATGLIMLVPLTGPLDLIPERSMTGLAVGFCILLASLVSLACVCFLVVRHLLRRRVPRWPSVAALVVGMAGAVPISTILLTLFR